MRVGDAPAGAAAFFDGGDAVGADAFFVGEALTVTGAGGRPFASIGGDSPLGAASGWSNGAGSPDAPDDSGSCSGTEHAEPRRTSGEVAATSAGVMAASAAGANDSSAGASEGDAPAGAALGAESQPPGASARGVADPRRDERGVERGEKSMRHGIALDASWQQVLADFGRARRPWRRPTWKAECCVVLLWAVGRTHVGAAIRPK